MSDLIGDIIEDFQKFYSKQLNESQAGFWRVQLGLLNEDDLCAGVMALKAREPTNWMPNVFTVKKYTLEAREIRLNQEKAQAPTYSDLERSARTEHGREAIRLILSMSERRIGRKEYIAGMREMHCKYPDYKWDEQANELEAFWTSEQKRHESGERFLETVWRLQDGMAERKLSGERKINQREFNSVHEKAEFYRKLWSGES